MTRDSVVDVTVILPVCDTMPELVDCLLSLVAQRMAGYSYEIVAVDDGSTDGSGELLDDHAKRTSNLRVVHQENAGWPGQPRNRAMDISESRYVFFADADDTLTEGALHDMVAFADEHGSDIVMPRLSGITDPSQRNAVWSQPTAVDADRALCHRSLSPQKLFRRSFLRAHDLRFPEGFVRLEDGLLLADAYWLARRVSFLAGDYYHKNSRGDGSNISYRPRPPWAYVESVTGIVDRVCAHAPAQAAERVMLDLFERKVLKPLAPGNFLERPAGQQAEWVAAAEQFARGRIPPELDTRLRTGTRLRARAARAGDVTTMWRLAAAVHSGTMPAWEQHDRLVTDIPGLDSGQAPVPITAGVTVTVRIVTGHCSHGEFHLELDVTATAAPYVLPQPRRCALILSRRHGDERIVVPLRAARNSGHDEATRVHGFLRPDLIGTRGRWDVWLRVAGGFQGRVAAPDGIPELTTPARHAVTPYVTERGNLSFKVHPGR